MFLRSSFLNKAFSYHKSVKNSFREMSTLTWPVTGLKADVNAKSKAHIINGRNIANKIKALLKNEIRSLNGRYQPFISQIPKLGYIIVGDKPDSELYVKMKKKAWKDIGIQTVGQKFDQKVSQKELEDYVTYLNHDQSVNGILIQMPLPDHIDSNIICDMIDQRKDVDGVHRLNMAAMARHEDPFYTPCTPKGIMCLIKSVCPNILGKKAVVIGRSNIVGMPIALLLQKEFATVTLCHAHTQNLWKEIETADIVVSATGCPHLIKGDFIMPGAIVIDVGTQFIEDHTSKSGKRLVGDIEYNSVSCKAGYVTPVPGGVGPMTIAMLMDNIVLAWKRSNFEHSTDIIDLNKSQNHLFSAPVQSSSLNTPEFSFP